jgi:hypothetical protein
MKRFFSLMLVVALCAVTASGCMKKTTAESQAPLVVLVMDTTQALLPQAQVQVGATTLFTSFDGKIVLEPERLKGVRKITIRCEGYKDERISLTGESFLIARLTPKKSKERGDGMVVGYGRSGRTIKAEAVRYSLAATSVDAKAAMTDEFVYEEAMTMPELKPMTGGPVANNVSAGKLTAGEVNDFAKWNLWGSYLQSTEAFQKTWGFVPRQRYTMQVMNKDGYPIVNYPVQIKDEQGNTLFQAITDNTGKAELWGKEGFQALVVDEPCEAPEGVDVMFVFDATGSMGDELRYLQAEMKDVIARAKEATGGLAIRTGAVVYRDHGDEYITRISRLTDDIAATQTFIDKQEASGGGDFPEAVPEALMAALNSAGWDENARARIAFLVLDAPCHQDSATLALMHEQILNAAAQGVRIVPVVCSGIDASAEYLLRAIALATNGTSFFLTDDSGIGNPHHKPTTDTLKVEHLNDMLVRTIVEFSTMPNCEDEGLNELTNEGVNEDFVPNPFNAQELEQNPDLPHGQGNYYIVDVSGKLLGIYQGEFEHFYASSLYSQLPIGVYFVKSYVNGQWITKKLLKR